MKTKAIIRVPVEQYKACIMFAYDSIETNLTKYAERNQNCVHKIFNDIVLGKVAEFGAYNYITDHQKLKCTLPDLNVYSKANKSYDADLHSEGFQVHVKSFAKYWADKYGYSWLFQKNDPVTTKPEQSDILCLTVVDDLEVSIMEFTRASECKFEEPELEVLKGNKVCVYLNTLRDGRP